MRFTSVLSCLCKQLYLQYVEWDLNTKGVVTLCRIKQLHSRRKPHECSHAAEHTKRQIQPLKTTSVDLLLMVLGVVHLGCFRGSTTIGSMKQVLAKFQCVVAKKVVVSHDWWRWFQQRHSKFTIRSAQHLSYC